MARRTCSGRKSTARGVKDYFPVVVISGEVGCGKPDPRIFTHTLAAAGCAATEALMIGNSLPKDVGGAQGVGLRAAWLNRAGTRPLEPITPEVEIRGLGALIRC